MWQRSLPELPPWPVAPRPFPEEAMGSWLGRVAARYGISVAQLCDEYGLELDIKLSRAGWLVLPPVPDSIISQLARLARLDEGRLHEIQTPIGWTAVTRRMQAYYCAHCLFANPVDVALLRWRRAWFNPNVVRCEVHGKPLMPIKSSTLRRCKNFDQTLGAVGRLELARYLYA